jgi:hypothetical protein
MFEMLHAVLPFNGETDMATMENIRAHEFAREMDDTLSVSCLELLKKLLDPNPSSRMSSLQKSVNTMTSGIYSECLPRLQCPS